MGNIMEEVKLEEVAEISSGLVLNRFSSDQEKEGEEYLYITLKSVEDNKINLELLECMNMERKVQERYILHKGDIIMKLAPPFSAALIDFDLPNLIAPSNFAIIRIKKDFDAEYLSFILNGKLIRRQLNRLVEGTILTIIKISYLNELKIKQRDKKEQIKYAKLLSLFLKRRELKKRILKLEEQLMNNILSNL
jgi:restriction endonuclease S subunit